MIKTITEDDFVQAFTDYNREDNFSPEARRALYNHITEVEDSTNQQIELDPIAICVEYTEYDSAWDAMKEYQPEDMPVEGEPGDDLVEIQAKNEQAAFEWLEERTQIIPVQDTGRVIIADF